MELLIEIFSEILLQIFLEALAELGLHALKEPFNKSPNPWLAAFGYTLFGSVAGTASLWLAPTSFITQATLRLLNLVVTPIVCGVTMAAIGALRKRRGQTLLRLNSFAYGFLFALPVAAIRFAYAHAS